MHDWSVRIEMAGAARELDPDLVGDLLEALEPQGAVASLGPSSLQVRLSVFANEAILAEKNALEAMTVAMDKVGLAQWPIIGIAATTSGELLRELGQPTVAPLVGVAETAEILRVSRQRVSELAKNRSFPRPVADLASGPVWIAAAVRSFGSNWDRRPGPKTRNLKGGNTPDK